MPSYRTAEVLRLVLDSFAQDLHVALPAEVVAFDAEAQTADVRPLIQNVLKDPDGTELAEDLPTLYRVPVLYPRSGAYFVAFPLEAGDFVQVLFNERSIDQFYEKGKLVHPVQLDKHGLSGAVAFPGFYPRGAPLGEDISKDMVLGKDEGSVIRIKPDGAVNIGATGGTNIRISSSGNIEVGTEGGTFQAVALADDVKAEFEKIKAAIEAPHTHTYIDNPGGVPSTTGPAPAGSYSPLAVGSSKVMVEK